MSYNYHFTCPFYAKTDSSLITSQMYLSRIMFFYHHVQAVVHFVNGFYYLLLNPKKGYLKPVPIKHSRWSNWGGSVRLDCRLKAQCKHKAMFCRISSVLFTCTVSADFSFCTCFSHDCIHFMGISLPHHPLIIFPSTLPSYSAQS